MIRSVTSYSNGNMWVIELIEVSRGIGRKATEVLSYGFNKIKHPNQYKSFLVKLAHEGIILDEKGNYKGGDEYA